MSKKKHKKKSSSKVTHKSGTGAAAATEESSLLSNIHIIESQYAKSQTLGLQQEHLLLTYVSALRGKNIKILRILTPLLESDDIRQKVLDSLKHSIEEIFLYLKAKPQNKTSKADKALIDYLEKESKLSLPDTGASVITKDTGQKIFKYPPFDDGMCHYMLALHNTDRDDLESDTREDSFEKAIAYFKSGLHTKINVIASISYLNLINSCYRNGDSELLEQLILETISDPQFQSSVPADYIPDIYTNLVKVNISDANYTRALKLAEDSYTRYSKAAYISAEVKFNIIYNLASCCVRIHQFTEALKYYEEAEGICDGIDKDIVKGKIGIFIAQDRYEEAMQEAKKFPDKGTSQFYQHMVLLANPNADKSVLDKVDPISVQEVLAKGYNVQSDFYLELFLYKNMTEEFLECYEHILERNISIRDTEYKLLKFINLCLKHDLIESCFLVHKKIYKLFSYLNDHQNTDLKYLECLLFLHNHMEAEFFHTLNALKHTATSSRESLGGRINKCEKSYIDQQIREKHYDKASAFLKQSVLDEGLKQSYAKIIIRLEAQFLAQASAEEVSADAQGASQAEEKLEAVASLSSKDTSSKELTVKADFSLAPTTDEGSVTVEKRSLEDAISLIELEFNIEDANFLNFTIPELHAYFQQQKKYKSLETLTSLHNSTQQVAPCCADYEEDVSGGGGGGGGTAKFITALAVYDDHDVSGGVTLSGAAADDSP